jgi:cation-dependent mannose-6-phosphate receptor
LIRSNETFAEVLGSSSDIHFEAVKDVKDTYQLIYSHGEKVIANVYLMCENLDQPYIKVLSNKDEPVVLAFNTPSACIQTHRHGLSGGSVLLIIFFIAFGVYFVGGIAILYFMRGARGLEAIPNIDFWRGLPGLVKDGLIFLFSGCNASSITTPETYDRI